jgi:DNA-binding PadR family transcriptional regulator
MSNYKKHVLLKNLYTSWKDGEDRTTSSYQITSFGRSLTVIELQKKTSYGILKIEELCITLSNDGYIEKITEDTDNKSHRYLITELGKSAFIDKHFLHKVFFFNLDFWKWILPFLVGLLGLLNSIFHWIEK